MYGDCVFVWVPGVFISVKERYKVKKVKFLFLIPFVGCLLIPTASVFARKHHACRHRHSSGLQSTHTHGATHDKRKHVKQDSSDAPDSAQRQTKEKSKD
jgi:hypothetical protein